MKRKKITTLMIAMTIMATSLPTTALAEVTGETQEITKEDLNENSTKDVQIPVECTVGATFTVKLPSKIKLESTDNNWRYTGQVGVKGDIDAGKTVNVTPDEQITVYDVTCRPTEDAPTSIDDQDYEHKDAKDATVTQAKTSWSQTDINETTYNDTDITLDAGKMQSGTWKGTLNVNIEYAGINSNIETLNEN